MTRLAEVQPAPLGPEELKLINAYWRAANSLSVGQIYLQANPLLREPLKLEHVKARLLGHWALGGRPLPAQSAVRECDRGREVARAAVAE